MEHIVCETTKVKLNYLETDRLQEFSKDNDLKAIFCQKNCPTPPTKKMERRNFFLDLGELKVLPILGA